MILLNDFVDLNLLSLCILVLAAPCRVFYAIKHLLYCRFDTDDIVLSITVILYQKHREKHTGHTGTTNTLTHILIHTHTYVCVCISICVSVLVVPVCPVCFSLCFWYKITVIERTMSSVSNLQ